MARPREFDEAAALEAAIGCFWRRGYAATSMRELTASMGISGPSPLQRNTKLQWREASPTSGHTPSAGPTIGVPNGGVMATGTVKFFNSQKGFGFIQPQDGGKDVFVHISAVERAGMSTLNEGQKVGYDVVSERGKLAAANLQAV
jgi:CspA family cold shock protein